MRRAHCRGFLVTCFRGRAWAVCFAQTLCRLLSELWSGLPEPARPTWPAVDDAHRAVARAWQLVVQALGGKFLSCLRPDNMAHPHLRPQLPTSVRSFCGRCCSAAHPRRCWPVWPAAVSSSKPGRRRPGWTRRSARRRPTAGSGTGAWSCSAPATRSGATAGLRCRGAPRGVCPPDARDVPLAEGAERAPRAPRPHRLRCRVRVLPRRHKAPRCRGQVARAGVPQLRGRSGNKELVRLKEQQEQDSQAGRTEVFSNFGRIRGSPWYSSLQCPRRLGQDGGRQDGPRDLVEHCA